MNPIFAARSVLFFSFATFSLETIFIHLWEYAADYLSTQTFISKILIGIAIGAALSSFNKKQIEHIFTPCVLLLSAGTIISLILLLINPTSLWASLGGILPFIAPGYYIANAFRDHRSVWVYAWDLIGCGMAVVFLFTAYQWINSEHIIGLFLCGIFLAGWIVPYALKNIRYFHYISLGCALLTGILLAIFWADPRLNIYKVLSQSHDAFPGKIFTKNLQLVRSYDNLISRTDVLENDSLKKKNAFFVGYSGCANDHIDSVRPINCKYDIRVVPPLTPDPEIFIIGTSAQGIVKTAKCLTRSEKINGVEINPAVFSIMNHDFKKESDYAYEGLSFQKANGIAFLKHSTRHYDLITLINSHSMPRISFLGPPDLLHTVEAYQTYLEHLTDQGTLLFEEIPTNERGELSIFRQISTIWIALQLSGYPAPEKHLFIYSWRVDKIRPFKKYPIRTYTGIMVKKTPLTNTDRAFLNQWLKTFHMIPNTPTALGPIRLNFLDGVFADDNYRQLISFFKKPSQMPQPFPGADLSPTSKNKPYSSQINTGYPELFSFLFNTLLITIPLIGFLLWMILAQRQPLTTKTSLLCHSFYQIGIGISYLLVEILLMQLYQPEFISISLSFPCILATLLIASGIGSLFLPSRASYPFIISITALSLLWHLILVFFLTDHITSYPIKLITIIFSVAITGFFMGFFLPWGLDRVKMLVTKEQIGVFFALNSIGGAIAIPLSLYLSVATGFCFLTITACCLYAASCLFITRQTT